MLKTIFYIVVVVLVLSFFGISLQHLVEAPATQTNFNYVWSLVLEGWDTVSTFATELWDSVF